MYYYRVYLYTGRKVEDKENIRDIAQNVFFHLWKYREQLVLQNPEAIIFKTCNQEISKFLKTAQREPFQSFKTETDRTDDFEEELQSQFIKEQRLTELEKSIELIIPPLRKRIFKMNKLESITQEEIALRLNIPKSTVKHHISQAMMFLKNHHKTLK